MGIFDLFKRKKESQQEEFVKLAEGPLSISFSLAAPEIKQKIKTWDLENPHLVLCLGYIAGYLDAAYQATRPQVYNEQLLDSVYYNIVENVLSDIHGADDYVDMGRIGLKHGGSSIGAMQGQPSFMTGIMAGGNDFNSFLNTSKQPMTLVQIFEKL